MLFRTTLAIETINNKMLKSEKLDTIEATILSLEEFNKSIFDSKIESAQAILKINDAKEVLFRSDIITELKSEISLEKIESIVRLFLQSASSIISISEINLSDSQSYIDSYSDRISSVIEASKSNAESASNLKFSSFRISPGVFIFVYAYSEKFKIDENPESQIITSTGLLIRMKISISDVKNQAEFDAKKIDQESLLKIKYIQASLLDDLFKKEIVIHTWTLYDNNYFKVANQISRRLSVNSSKNTMQIGSGRKGSPELQKLVKGYIEKLKTLNDTSLNKAIEVSEDRIARSYY